MITQTFTAEELIRMPDDGFRYELVKGELIQMSPSGQRHGKVTARLTWRLAKYVEDKKLGEVYAAETGFLISSNPDTVRAPDAAFVSKKRLKEVGEVEGYFPGAPDMAIEVISPGDTQSKVEEKIIEWLTSGSLIVIALDPRKQTVTVYRDLNVIEVLTNKDVLECEDILPGWSVNIDKLFT